MTANQIDERKVFNGMLILGGTILSLLTVYFIISARGNVVGNAYKFFLPVGFLLGLTMPRIAIYAVLLCAGYIDLLKRFMVFDLQMTPDDLYFILGIPPMIVLGIAVHVISSYLLRWRALDTKDIKLILISASVSIVFGIQSYGGIGGMQNLVNNMVYPLMIFCLPIFFPNRMELLKLIRFIMIIFIPVALYGIKQSIFGLSDFEMQYTMSGMTTVASAVFDFMVRPFSTLASEGQLSFAMSFCAVMAYTFPLVMYHERKLNPFIVFVCLVLFVLFATTGVLSLKRMPVLIWIVAIVGSFFFGNRFRTALYYFTVAMLVLTMVFSGRYLLRQFDKVALTYVEESDRATMLLRTGTFNSRLNAFELLKDPDSYTMFGIPPHLRTEKHTKVHTIWAHMLVNHGVFPMAILGIFLVTGLFFLHYPAWDAPPGTWKALYLVFLSTLLATALVTALGTLALMGFPSVFFTYFILACLFLLLIKDNWKDDPVYREEKLDPSNLDAPVSLQR